MLELGVRFTPADGGPQRSITLRLGAPVKGATSWSVLVELEGFDKPHARPIHGQDWAQAVELAARILPFLLELRVHQAGGGTLDPPFYEREAPDLSQIPPEIRAILDGPTPP